MIKSLHTPFSFLASLKTKYISTLYLLFVLAMSWNGWGQTVTTYSTAGTYTWTCPPGVTSIQVEAWGGGGAGGGTTSSGTNKAAGGGGGGAYQLSSSVTVTPGTTYTIIVGAGGTGVSASNGNDGTNSTFGGTLVIANGGKGGTLASASGAVSGGAGGIGTKNGGLGGTSLTTSSGQSGAGGGGAGSTGNGGDASGTTAGTGGTGSAGKTGGAGASGRTSNNSGATGNAIGGGGSGARQTGSTASAGGAGGAGKVLLTYTGYCTPLATVYTSYITNFTTTGATTNINNNSTYTTNGGGYSNYYSTNAMSITAGSSFTASVSMIPTATGSNGVSIFVDFNKNGLFTDSGEQIFTSASYQGSPYTTSSITIPSSTVADDYVMRVIIDYNATSPTSCSFSSGRGEAEDYKLTVSALTSPYVNTTAVTAFGNTCINTTGSPNSTTVTGGNLTGNITLGSLAGFSYCTTAGGTYTSTLDLTPSSGSVNQIVYIKFNPTLVQSYSGNIPITGGGLAATVNVPVTGAGVNTAPSVSVNGTAGSITSSGATISSSTISALGCSSVTAYGIEYSPTSGFTNGTGTQVAGTGFSGSAGGTFSTALSGLSASTTYYYKAFATNSGGTTYYSSQSSFTTACASINSFPYSQGFNTASTIPNCYSASEGSTGSSIHWDSVTSDSSHGAGTPAEGSAFMRMNYFSAQTAYNPYYFNFPTFELGATPKRATFKIWMGSASGTNSLVVQVSSNAGSSWTDLATYTANASNTSSSAAWESKIIDLTAYVSQSITFRLKATSNYGSNFCNIGFDNFVVENIPTCQVPASISATTSVTSTTATINWTASPSSPAEGYEWEVRSSGAGGSGATGLAASGSVAAGVLTANATGLSGATSYTVYVRSKCSSSDFSAWTSGGTFVTACAIPNAPSNVVTSNVTSTTLTVGFTAASPAPTGYMLFLSTTSTTIPNLVNGTIYTANANYTIDGIVYKCVISNSTSTSFDLTSGTPNTQHNYFAFSRSSTNSCTGAPWYSSGVTGFATTCPSTPTTPTATSITYNGATIGWTTPSGQGTAGVITYTLEVYADSGYSTPISGSPFTGISANSQSISGLGASTTYYYKIKANNTFCDSGYLMGSFTTACQPESIDSTTPASRCGSGSVTLGATATGGANVSWYAASTGGTSLGTGTSFTTPTLSATTNYYVSATKVYNSSLTTGSGVSTSTSLAISPYYHTYGGAKTQYIFKASELIAMGLTAGNITQLSLNITSLGTTPLNGFSISIGHTSQNAAVTNTAITSGLTSVYSNTAQALTLGTNTYTFSTPFNWNGTSNIVISFSYSNNNSGGTSSGIAYTAAGFTSSLVLYSDNASPTCILNAVSDVASCFDYYYYGNDISSNRPNITLSGQMLCESPRTTVTATINTPPALTLSSSSETICSGSSSTPITLTAGASDYDTFTWIPAIGVSGNSTSGWIFNPSITTSYILEAVNSVDGCNEIVAFDVIVNPSPSPVDITNTNTSICGNQIQTLNVNSSSITGATTTISSGTVNLAIPDNSSTGVTQNLVVSGIPNGATITKVDVNFNLNHAFLADAEIVLKAPNGKYIALAADQGPLGSGSYTNTTITSNNSASALSTTSTPITGTYKANATLAANLKGSFGTNLTSTFADLFTTANGTWAVIAYDDANTDTGTLVNCSITLTYDVNIPISWSASTSPSYLYTDATCTTAYTGQNLTTVYARPVITTTYTATATLGSCTKSDDVTYTIDSNIWDGSVWSKGAEPTSNETIIVNDDLNLGTNLSGCSCVLNSGTITIPAGKTLTVENGILNNGTIIIEDTGSLVQTNETNTNSGTGIYKVYKSSRPYHEYDYNYWSSPIENAAFSTTFGTNSSLLTGSGNGASDLNYIYELNTAAFADDSPSDTWDDNYNDWVHPSGNMTRGKGYIVLGAGADFPFNASDFETGFKQQVRFDGNKVNNGAFTYTLFDDIDATTTASDNLIGNPYPSAIDAIAFYNANSNVITSTALFWTHDTQVALGGGPGWAYNFTNSDYALFNLDTGTGASANATPVNKYIASGQGFTVQLKDGSSSDVVSFTNAMRATDNTHFVRMANQEYDVLWLNMTDNTGLYRQIAVGFYPQGTEGIDVTDSPKMATYQEPEFYSLIPENTSKLAIQGLADFNVDKQIPIGLTTTYQGNYQITLDHFDGIFTQGQAIYLEDTYLNVIHDLGAGAYSFTQTAGENINDRFVLRFTNATAGTPEQALANLVIYPNPSTGKFFFHLSTEENAEIEVSDITGKRIQNVVSKELNGNYTINLTDKASGVYFAKITTDKGQVTKKLVVE